MFTKAEWLKSTNLSFVNLSFFVIIFLRLHTKTMGNLEKEMTANEVVVEAIAGKRPLIYDELLYNLCEMAHRNQLFFLQ